MAVRFVIGRAGCGKTYHCLEAVRARLRRDPIDGPRLILLVPEQAALQMERAIIEPEDIGTAHRAEVLSFRRLAQRVLDYVGGPVRRALSEPARAMVLRHLIRQRADRLEYYRRVERLGGFVDRLAATITELIQEAVDPDDLTAVGGSAAGLDPAQRAKLHDVREIYAAYLEYLGADRLDPSQQLQIARELLPRCDWVCGAEVWVDGFASLMQQETLTLVELAKLCQHLDITALIEPSLLDTTGRSRGGSMGSLFRKTYRTYGEMNRAFVEAGLSVEEPLLLRGEPSARFCGSVGLGRLEQRLAGVDQTEPADADSVRSSVELIELPSRRIEVEYAVSRLCEWIRDPAGSYRYRDVAVIVRDLEPYHDLLTEALSSRGIPFFIDWRRRTAHHPLVELLRAAMALAADDLSRESVRVVLKTDLLPIAKEAADRLENYLLAHGINGLNAWRGDDWSFAPRSSFMDTVDEPGAYETAQVAAVNETRRWFLDLIDPWLGFALDDRGHAGGEWSVAIEKWLGRIEAEKTIEAWAEQSEGEGDLDQASEHRQVWRDTAAFLDDLAFAFADVTLGAEELADVIQSGLSGLTLGLAPPMVDQVLVGSIERSRHPDIKAAVVVGFNDGVFPAVHTEDSVLNDDDRTLLTRGGVKIGPPSRERVLDESLLVYIAVTRASRDLVVTYAASDTEGKALRPSPYVETLRSACPGLTVTGVSDPARSRATWDILSTRDLAARLVLEMRARGSIDRDDTPVRARWNELYDCVRGSLSRDAAWRRALLSLGDPERAAISPASVERLYAAPLRTSVSELETYAVCPFQHFAKYALRLRERAEAELAPIDIGKVHHAILEDFVNTLADRRQVLGQLSDGEVVEGLRESCERVAMRLPGERIGSGARDAYLLRRTAAQLARVIRAQRNVSKAGAARPRAAELPFGFPRAGSLPAMELSTPSGRRVLLRGYIDRVDLAELGDELLGIVVDYKRTRDKTLNLSEVYHGLSLQLPAYLLAIAQHGRSLAGRSIRPAAGLYVSLLPHREVVDHPSMVSKRQEALPGSYRPRGVINTDCFEALEGPGASGAWSDSFSMYRKGDGTFGHVDTSDAADGTSFQALLDHTRTKLGELADGILDGDTAVRPYRIGNKVSPCSWCPMPSVCRFEMGVSEVRFLDQLKRSDVFKRLTDSA